MVLVCSYIPHGVIVTMYRLDLVSMFLTFVLNLYFIDGCVKQVVEEKILRMTVRSVRLSINS